MTSDHYFMVNGLAFENFHLFLHNRKLTHVAFMSANPLKIIAAASQGIAVIPVLSHEAIGLQ